MKKKMGMGVLIFLIFIMSACQRTPERVEEDGVRTVAEETIQIDTAAEKNVREQIPQTLKMNVVMKDNAWDIDAHIIIPDAEIYSGIVVKKEVPDEKLLSQVLFDGESLISYQEYGNIIYLVPQEDGVMQEDSKYCMYSFDIEDSGLYFSYADNSLRQYFSLENDVIPETALTQEQKAQMDMSEHKILKYLQDLGTNHVVRSMRFNDGTYPYFEFFTVPALDGIQCVSGLNGSGRVVCDGRGEISEYGLGTLSMIADFEIIQKDKCTILSWEKIIDVLKQLAEQQRLRRVDGTLPISVIELKYLIKNNNDVLEFCPIWSFEAYSETLGGLQYVFAVNAVDGTLEYMNEFF